MKTPPPRRRAVCHGYYSTRYKSGCSTYSGSIAARSWNHARDLAAARNLGEVVEGFSRKRDAPQASEVFWSRTSKEAEAIHAVTYLCALGARAGVAEGMGAMEDTGLLHEVVHYFAFRKDDTVLPRFRGHLPRRVLYDRIVALEKAVPGYRPRARRPRR